MIWLFLSLAGVAIAGMGVAIGYRIGADALDWAMTGWRTAVTRLEEQLAIDRDALATERESSRVLLAENNRLRADLREATPIMLAHGFWQRVNIQGVSSTPIKMTSPGTIATE